MIILGHLVCGAAEVRSVSAMKSTSINIKGVD